MRELTTIEALREAVDIAMEKYPNVFIIGEGVSDPKSIFGSTLGLHKKYPDRVFDSPISENGMTGICIGSALTGLRPILIHQRAGFSLYSFDQIINIAAKWHSLYGGNGKIPLVIRMIIGRGWGQSSQHCQNLQSLFAHIPGLKVVMPSTPYDAKGLLISSIEDNNPVIFLEHRWIQRLRGDVSKGYYKIPLGKAKIVKEGKDLTIISTSFMTIESLKAAKELEKIDINVEIVDVRTLKPLDTETILNSVKKTKKLLAIDLGWKTSGFASEIITTVTESIQLSALPQRITSPDLNVPATPGLAKDYYPNHITIIRKVLEMLNREDTISRHIEKNIKIPYDVPDPEFTGPF